MSQRSYWPLGSFRYYRLFRRSRGTSLASSGALALEPVRPRLHDERLRALLVDLRRFHQLVDGQLGQLVARVDVGVREPGRELAIHALEREQVLAGGVELLLGGDRLGEQHV